MKESSGIQLFNKLYLENHKRFLSFAYTYVQDEQLAEDITVEAFMNYWENRDQLATDSNIPAYILTTIKNKCLNHLQHKVIENRVLNEMYNSGQWKLHTRILTLEACNPENLFASDVERIIRETLDSLPERTHDIFVLSRFKDKSYKEIASLYHITTKGVEFHISKAMEKFRRNLKDYLFCILFLFQ